MKPVVVFDIVKSKAFIRKEKRRDGVTITVKDCLEQDEKE